MKNLTIGRLAKAANVGVETIRFYEREGLLPPAPRSASGYRVFSDADVRRLRFIRRGKDLGFTLQEINELLALQEGGGRRDAVKALTERKVHDIEAKIRDLEQIKDVLAGLSRRCSGRGPVKGCPIIEALSDTRG
ncbi:MAG: MerR family transcriptional regulator [Gammaproteobacteria bacterium]